MNFVLNTTSIDDPKYFHHTSIKINIPKKRNTPIKDHTYTYKG